GILGGDPSCTLAFEAILDELLDDGSADHARSSVVDQNRAFGLRDESAGHAYRAHLIRRSSVMPGHFCATFFSSGFSSGGLTLVMDKSICSGSSSRTWPARVSFSIPPMRILTSRISGRLYV